MHLATMIRAGCLAACAAVASGLALQRGSAHSVFVLGCSVDRFAVADFCWSSGKKFDQLMCVDEERDLTVGYMFHPGVGMNGDFQPPFWNHSFTIIEKSPVSNSTTLHSTAMDVMKMEGSQFPDMVVVESSLWDLFTWASQGGKNVTKERLHQWGRSDLKHLMARVSEAFPQSRIVFRTGPRVNQTMFLQVLLRDEGNNLYTVNRPDVSVVSVEAMDSMKREVDKHMQNGKLYGEYEIIDYYQIMNDLIEERGSADPSLWMRDGIHPAKWPGRRYMNEILKLMKVATVSDEDWEKRVQGALSND